MDSEVDEKEPRGLDKSSLDDNQKQLRKCEFGRKIENISDMKSFNDMDFIHNNEVNNIDKCDLLHFIINSYKRTKT